MTTLALLLAASACGGRSTLDEAGTGLPPGAVWPSDSYGDGEDAGGNAAPDASEDPSIDPANPKPSIPSVTEGFGPVCLDFLETFNEASDRKACLTCITDAQRGPCRLEHQAAADTDPPCGKPNDCASVMCQCTDKSCPPGLCDCIERCMRFSPDACLDRWTNLWSCVRHACDEACS